MKKLVYKTPNGQLTVNSDESVVLEFQNLFMQLSNERFVDFVDFVNTNISKLIGNEKEEAHESFSHSVLRNMNIELASEFLKLVNAPVFSIDDKFDIFDSLKELKSNHVLSKSLGNVNKHGSIYIKEICPN